MADAGEMRSEARRRYALFGVIDDATSAVEAELAADTDGSIGREIETYRWLRKMLELAGTTEPPAALVEDTIRKLKEKQAEASPFPAGVYRASVMQQFVGVRAVVGDDINLACAFGDYRLNAVLHGAGHPDQFAVSGQLVLGDAEPVCNLAVALLVDGVVVEATRTDEFGEFEFGTHGGETFALCVGDGEQVAGIELKGDSPW